MDGEGEEEDIFVLSPFAWGDSEISQWDFDLSQGKFRTSTLVHLLSALRHFIFSSTFVVSFSAQRGCVVCTEMYDIVVEVFFIFGEKPSDLTFALDNVPCH